MNSTMALKETKMDPYLAAFEEVEVNKAANTPAWLHSVRKAGISHFAEAGLPTLQNEEWVFTNIAPVADLGFKPLLAPADILPDLQSLEKFGLTPLKGPRLVFVDGHYAPALSHIPTLPAGVLLENLASVLAKTPEKAEKHLAHYAPNAGLAFPALNTAFFTDGLFLHLSKNAVLEEPILAVFVATTQATGAAIHPRNLLIGETNSQALVIEHYVSLTGTAYLTNAVTEIVVSEGARLEHCKLQDENPQAFHFATIHGNFAQNSHLTSHSIALGARLSRNNIDFDLLGTGIEGILNGLYFGTGQQLMDHHTVVNHAQPHCNTHEFYNGIMAGQSRGVFNGKIFVRPGAQKTDAKQSNRNLLLSDTAHVNTKPQLEIFADDVKCTHGCTVGELDEEAIFYLQARGIGKADAKRLLTLAFASEIVERISHPALRDLVNAIVLDRLEHAVELT
jgi:Fe-S cluster assembly protein SufD